MISTSKPRNDAHLNPTAINPNNYNPISTLEQQYAHHPLGRRLTLLLRLNDACLVPGGVETVLHSTRGRTVAPNNHDVMEAAVENSLGEQFDNLNVNKNNSTTDGEDAVHPEALAPPFQDPDTDTTSVSSSTTGNAFDFLYDSAPTSSSTSFKSSKISLGGGGNKNKLMSSFGSNIKRIAKSTQHQIERRVTSMAIQAQKASSSGGEHSDIVTVGAYIQDGLTGQFNICLGMTETVKMPVSSSSTSVNRDGKGVTFQIPIILPPNLLDETVVSSGVSVQFQLWIRSGASFLAKNKAFHKYYSVGIATLRMSNLLKAIPPSPTRQFQPANVLLPLQSSIVTGGQVGLTIIPDMKFPQLCGIGWTLADPRTDTAYLPGNKMLFNPPLDQSYVFIPPKETQSENIILATERATESTLVLPLALSFSRLLSAASSISLSHAKELSSRLQCLDDNVNVDDPIKAMQSGHAQCQLDICYFVRYRNDSSNSRTPGLQNVAAGGGKVMVTVNFQRPDSIFESCLASGAVHMYSYSPNVNYPPIVAISVPFYPRVVDRSDSRLLPGLKGAISGTGGEGASVGKRLHLGTLRIEIREEGVGGVGADIFSPVGPAGVVGTSPRMMETLVEIEPYLNANLGEGGIVQAPVVDLRTGESVGVLMLKLAANTLEGMVDKNPASPDGGILARQSGDVATVDGGLVSLVGLDTLMEDDKGCYPHLDLEVAASGSIVSPLQPNPTQEQQAADRRKRQIGTMGEFLTYEYMQHYEVQARLENDKILKERCKEYEESLLGNNYSSSVDIPTPDKRKDPRPFRPSSSRMDNLLSGIGFNVHVQNFSLVSLLSNETTGSTTIMPTALFQNVTCGAPADHFRGFGSTKGKDGGTSASGGLRRLEATRANAAQHLKDIQNKLIDTVAQFFVGQTHNQPLTKGSKRHVPPSNPQVSQLRKSAISATQNLHRLTWEIAVRRGNVFSQALGIGVTLYLALISDVAKMQGGGWADLWKHHGFLITFEGLLSAAGKELGMIEDAAVGIKMLRMVSVVLLPDHGCVEKNNVNSRVPVLDSPYVKWINIIPSGVGSKMQYRVEVGLDANYFSQRVPITLRDGTAVRFYPTLYQMGVDIRQWGANAGMNIRGSKIGTSSVANNRSYIAGDENVENGNIVDDGEDDIGIPDNDVLIALNYEAFRKMNAYAHAISPTSSFEGNQEFITWEQADREQQMQQPIHHMLATLYESIRLSAGKMDHGVMDKAATAAAKLGGGGAIFCKSGKDRTAMQVTFKQSQFVNRFLFSGGDGFTDSFDNQNVDKIYDDATLMRIHGTRLPICDKNVGQAMYAFNSLQARFMPDMLKPPPRTLAGFLKGGRVFSREGAIES